MFFRKKEIVPLNSLMRSILASGLHTENFNIFQVDSEHLLSENEKAILSSNLPAFIVVTYFQIFVDRFARPKTLAVVEDISRRCAMAIVFACQDRGMSEAETTVLTDQFQAYNEDYQQALEGPDAARIEKMGPFFFYCQRYSNALIAVPKSLRDGAAHMIAFEIANQTYRKLEAILDDTCRHFKIV